MPLVGNALTGDSQRRVGTGDRRDDRATTMPPRTPESKESLVLAFHGQARGTTATPMWGLGDTHGTTLADVIWHLTSDISRHAEQRRTANACPRQMQTVQRPSQHSTHAHASMPVESGRRCGKEVTDRSCGIAHVTCRMCARSWLYCIIRSEATSL